MRQYIVTKDILNIRSRPSDESDDTYIGQLLKGESVYLNENAVEGSVPKNGISNLWLGDNYNRFVSQEGIRLKNYQDKKAEFLADPFNKPFYDATDPNDESKWKVSWGHIDLEIWKIWRDYNVKGKDVKIAIIDSGKGKDVSDLDNVTTQIYAPNDGGILEDEYGHGTLTAGVIGAMGNSIVYGVAPECEMTMIKREGKNGLLSEDFDYAALCAVSKDIDILNISLEFVKNTQRINDEISRIALQGTLIIVAAGDGLSKKNDNIFPANHPNVIPITALNKAGGLYFQALFNSNTKWILPGEQLLSCDQYGRIGFQDATSAAAPFMTGLIALFISFRKQMGLSYTNEQLLEQLSISASKISFNDANSSYSFYLPDTIQAFLKLKLSTN